MAKATKQNNKTITCLNCPPDKNNQSVRNFYSLNPNSKKHEQYKNLGKIPICKGCLRQMCFLRDGNIPDEKGLKNALEWLDIPYKKSIVLDLIKENKFDLGEYSKRIKLSYPKETYENSDKAEDITNKKEIVNFDTIDEFEEEFVITKEMIKRWGRNLSQDDYEFLEDTYKDWTHRYKCDTLAEEKTYQFLSLKELEIRKTRESNGNVDKLEETYRKFMSDANVTPRDANAANDPENQNSLGLWIKDIEKYRPAEYFEQKKLYVDFDKLKEYLDRFVFRPLKNLLTGSRDFDKEFNVEKLDEEEMTDETQEDGDK